LPHVVSPSSLTSLSRAPLPFPLLPSFFLMPRRPPRSALSPYTTLFRSRGARVLGVGMTADGANEIARRARGTPRIAGRLLRRVRDRKSTRLNSSHVKISYAVFCLKKKNVARTEEILAAYQHT